jgi:antitoxin component YwqK of YwqJK toxin-antitoxin module
MNPAAQELFPMSHAFFSLVAAVLMLTPGLVLAQGAKIEPYTGEPIYLESPPAPVPAKEVENSVKTEKYDNGKVWIERGVTRFSDNSLVSNGVYKEFYRDGQQFVEGQFTDGVPTGEWTYWRPNGQVAKKVTHKQGQPDGQVELLREDGTLAARKEFQLGKRNGQWETFDATGEKPLTEEHYAGGKPDGTWKWWYESGQLMRQTTFVDGKIDGEAAEWAEDGTQRAVANFKAGKRQGLSTQWMADGQKVEQMYDEGKPVSKDK